MINVKTEALVGCLRHIGVNSETISRTVRAVLMMNTDPVACPFHHLLEDQLLTLCEDCGLYSTGTLPSLDELIVHINAVCSTLMAASKRYREHRITDRADLVFDAANGISRTIVYA